MSFISSSLFTFIKFNLYGLNVLPIFSLNFKIILSLCFKLSLIVFRTKLTNTFWSFFKLITNWLAFSNWLLLILFSKLLPSIISNDFILSKSLFKLKKKVLGFNSTSCAGATAGVGVGTGNDTGSGAVDGTGTGAGELWVIFSLKLVFTLTSTGLLMFPILSPDLTVNILPFIILLFFKFNKKISAVSLLPLLWKDKLNQDSFLNFIILDFPLNWSPTKIPTR